MKHEKYDKLNELLNQKSMSNENLLTELRYLKKSYFGQDRSYFPSTDNAQTTGFINQMEKYIDVYVHSHDQSGPILLSSQNAIFREIIGLQIESNQLKQQLQIERNKSSRLAKQLEKMKANPDTIFNDDLRRQKNLLFRPQQFERIKNEIKEIANRIQAFGSTDDQIESKIQVLKAKNEELQHRKLQLQERVEGRKILLQNKHRLVVFNRPEEEQQQEINGQQIIAVLKARLQLEAQIEAETAQKQQFIQLLLDFKNKSAEVMNKNSQLKQQIKQKGLELPDQ